MIPLRRFCVWVILVPEAAVIIASCNRIEATTTKTIVHQIEVEVAVAIVWAAAEAVETMAEVAHHHPLKIWTRRWMTGECRLTRKRTD